jgi:methylenetetrahydrofolate dehydrogenase (NADP+)/methenyltetrahydrofolate cyclohydrolase
MVIDGKQIASELLAEVKASLGGRTCIVRAVVVAPSPATESYLRIKTIRAEEAGMSLQVVRLDDNAKEEQVIDAIRAPGADAVIVQMPLPLTLNPVSVLAHIPRAKDADVLSMSAYEAFVSEAVEALIPPVAAAVAEILRRNNVNSFEGKKVVIIGKGKLVGQPVATWFRHQGVIPEIIDKDSSASLAVLLKGADIVVSGAGQAGLIVPEMLTPGVVLIDAGTSESNGALAGDIDPACAQIASVFTPVPGGVGPIAVAMLFKNTAQLGGV